MGLLGFFAALQRGWLTLAVLFAVGVFAPALAADQKPLKGVALVVGQSSYQHLTTLANPLNDARAIGRLLSDLGFEVVTVLDGDRKKLAKSLQRFAEDAADADVALLYYSGHGIEAGGEDFLVAVDVDLSALDDAGAELVPLSAILDGLKASVPVTIVLLDACRTSPFPPGAALRVDGQSAPVAAAGLAAPKGAVALATPAAPNAQNLATVIGFAAEPGQAALDGAPDGNSPYAAALIKHLAAKGFDFGDVMTMVTEEVYLVTKAEQRPWTNASLRRLLYFGMADAKVDQDTDQAAIRGERRKLLLTIATAPQDTRDLVEAIARRDAVPLDQLYGMLDVLDVDVSGGNGELENQLRAGAEKLKSIIDNRDAVQRQDPELIRLSGLADEAEQEGAIKLALDFRGRASRRADEIGKAVDEAEAGVRARRAELAATYRQHAETAILNFDFATAAEKYGAAYLQAAKFDPGLAYVMKLNQADAELDHGTYSGDKAALEASVLSYQSALDGAPRSIDRVQLAMAASNLGNALVILGERETDTRHLEEAARAYGSALKVLTRKRYPREWAGTQLNLGNVYHALGVRGAGTADLKRSAEAYRAAIKGLPRDEVPFDWAGAQNNLGNTLSALSERTGDRKIMTEAIEAYEASLEVRTRESAPVDWAAGQMNLGVAFHTLGAQTDDPVLFEKAVTAYRAALEVETREKMPFQWASTMNDLANTLEELGHRETGTARYEEAVTALRATLDVFTPESDPLSRARVHFNLGRIIAAMAERQNSAQRYEEAVAELRLAIPALEKADVPLMLSRAESRMAETLLALGKIKADRTMLTEARAAYQSAWAFWKSQGETKFDKYFKDQLAEVDAAVKAAP